MNRISLIVFFMGLVFFSINAQEHFCEDHLFAYTSIHESKGDTTLSDSISTTKIIEEEEEEERSFFDEADWTLGPNPTYDVVNIFGDQDNIKSIELFSITGELLEFYDTSNLRNSIDLSPYQNGIYLVRILSRYNELKTYKVIKR